MDLEVEESPLKVEAGESEHGGGAGGTGGTGGMVVAGDLEGEGSPLKVGAEESEHGGVAGRTGGMVVAGGAEGGTKGNRYSWG